jgi:hypothetical protein
MTIKKSDFLLNFLMFCLGATVGRRIGDSYIVRHLAAKSADSMLMNIPHCLRIVSAKMTSCMTRSQSSDGLNVCAFCLTAKLLSKARTTYLTLPLTVVAADDAMAAAAAFFLCLTMLEGRVRLPYEGVSGVGIFDKFNISNVRQRP